MSYVKIVDGVVVQKQPYPAVGFVQAADDVVCGYLQQGASLVPPPPTPAPVPESISPSQFLRSLNHFGFRATVDAAIAGADQDTKDWYARATSFDRHHQTVVAMAQAMGYTPAQMDQVWTYGASL